VRNSHRAWTVPSTELGNKVRSITQLINKMYHLDNEIRPISVNRMKLDELSIYFFLLWLQKAIIKKLYVNPSPVLSIDGSGDDGYQQDVGIHRREDGQASQVAGRQRQGQVWSSHVCHIDTDPFLSLFRLRWNSWKSIWQKTRVFWSMLFTVPSTGGF